MEYLLLIIGFIVLIKWADLVVVSASSIAKVLWVSSLMIGLTVVAFGTSAPEFFVNIISVSKWQTDLALWNILGSIIMNTLLVLWIAALINPLKAKSSTVYKEVPFLLLWGFALIVASSDVFLSGQAENVITRNEWILFLLYFLIFLVYTFGLFKTNEQDDEQEETKIFPFHISIIYLILWIVGLVLWGNLLVSSAWTIARWWGVSESVIGLTIVAFGTSLPELATSAIAAYKKNSDIAIWNVVGSNIYGIFLILWSSATTSNLLVSDSTFYDIIIAFAVTLLLSLFLFFGGWKAKITKTEWFILIFLYFIYIWYLFYTQILA